MAPAVGDPKMSNRERKKLERSDKTRPQWPFWFGGVGFLVALLAYLVVHASRAMDPKYAAKVAAERAAKAANATAAEATSAADAKKLSKFSEKLLRKYPPEVLKHKLDNETEDDFEKRMNETAVKWLVKDELKAVKTAEARFMEMAVELREMAKRITADLDEGTFNLIDGQLNNIDNELVRLQKFKTVDDPPWLDLTTTVSVLRGELHQIYHNLSDDEVAEIRNAFTYSNPDYWDNYYKKMAKDTQYDAYFKWEDVASIRHPEPEVQDDEDIPDGGSDAGKPQEQHSSLGDVVSSYLTPEAKILMLGCGNSDMSEKMYQRGFEHITNVDISHKLIEDLRERLAPAHPNMRWLYMNASALEFDEGTIDIVADKGTLDALEHNANLQRLAVREAFRTLKPGGYLVSISYNGVVKRVDNQLRRNAAFGKCLTHTLTRAKVGKHEDDMVIYVHACQRPLKR